MIDRFEAMLEMQAQLQLSMPDGDPRNLRGDHRAEFMTWNAFALEDEIHEAFQEIGWKPWATSRHINEEAFLAEMVDAWHFFMNLLWAGTGITEPEVLADKFYQAYRAKNQKNFDRQQEGYDGVSEKCPICKRELLTPYPSAGKTRVCPEHGPQGEVLS